MPSNSEQLLYRAPPVLDQATSVLVAFLHCSHQEALALLRAQAHGAHVDLLQVAAAVVEADSPVRQWRWGVVPRRAAAPLSERMAMSAA